MENNLNIISTDRASVNFLNYPISLAYNSVHLQAYPLSYGRKQQKRFFKALKYQYRNHLNLSHLRLLHSNGQHRCDRLHFTSHLLVSHCRGGIAPNSKALKAESLSHQVALMHVNRAQEVGNGKSRTAENAASPFTPL